MILLQKAVRPYPTAATRELCGRLSAAGAGSAGVFCAGQAVEPAYRC